MISPDCHKDLPKIEHSLISSIVEICHEGLPPLQVRNHSAATKFGRLFCAVIRLFCLSCWYTRQTFCDKTAELSWQRVANLNKIVYALHRNPFCVPIPGI